MTAAEQFFGAGGKLVEGGANDRQIGAARIGQRQLSPIAVEERLTEPRLELLYLLADRALRESTYEKIY